MLTYLPLTEAAPADIKEAAPAATEEATPAAIDEATPTAIDEATFVSVIDAGFGGQQRLDLSRVPCVGSGDQILTQSFNCRATHAFTRQEKNSPRHLGFSFRKFRRSSENRSSSLSVMIAKSPPIFWSSSASLSQCVCVCVRRAHDWTSHEPVRKVSEKGKKISSILKIDPVPAASPGQW